MAAPITTMPSAVVHLPQGESDGSGGGALRFYGVFHTDPPQEAVARYGTRVYAARTIFFRQGNRTCHPTARGWRRSGTIRTSVSSTGACASWARRWSA